MADRGDAVSLFHAMGNPSVRWTDYRFVGEPVAVVAFQRIGQSVLRLDTRPTYVEVIHAVSDVALLWPCRVYSVRFCTSGKAPELLDNVCQRPW